MDPSKSMTASSGGTTARRRLGAWGFEGEAYPPSAQLLGWLEKRLGSVVVVCDVGPYPAQGTAAASAARNGRGVSHEDSDRIAHARGQGLTDLLRLRSGTVPALPDAVVRPREGSEVDTILRSCAAADVRVIPWGGGTSVTAASTLSLATHRWSPWTCSTFRD